MSSALRATSREPIKATARVVPPYLYKVLWELAQSGPLTAGEIAENRNRPISVQEWEQWTPQQAANRLRSVQKLGLVERDKNGFWLLSRAGRTWITVGAER